MSMIDRVRHRRLVAVLSFVLALLVASASLPQSAAAAVVYPNSMAALGDSITRAYNTGSSSFRDAPANSWSTGTNSTVNSLYRRILANNSAISGKNYNDAVSGAKMIDLAGQVATVNNRGGVEYVTILMGGNDVCTSNESTMTSVAEFRAQFQTAMESLMTGSPNARIYVVSIPDISQLWRLYKDNGTARFTWSLFRICQSMLANPLSTQQADVQRRERVRQRNIDFNTQLREVCTVLYSMRCRYDNDAVFTTPLQRTDVSTRDYFHPSLAGQTKLARVAWENSGLRP